MDNQGYIKLHRILFDKPIWKCGTPEQKVLLVTLIMLANHKDNEWEWNGNRYQVDRGQLVTSLSSLKKYCGKGFTIKKIRTCLEKFRKYEFLAYKGSYQGLLITICNYEQYQLSENIRACQVAHQGHAKGTPRATNNNDKNDKNDKNIYSESATRIVDKFINYIKSHHPNQLSLQEHKIKQTTNKWRKQVDIMITKDRLEPSVIEKVIDWCQSDGCYWQDKIMSIEKLRKQWDTVRPQMERVSDSGFKKQEKENLLERHYRLQEERRQNEHSGNIK